jgi:hypothetical protein
MERLRHIDPLHEPSAEEIASELLLLIVGLVSESM